MVNHREALYSHRIIIQIKLHSAVRDQVLNKHTGCGKVRCWLIKTETRPEIYFCVFCIYNVETYELITGPPFITWETHRDEIMDGNVVIGQSAVTL